MGACFSRPVRSVLFGVAFCGALATWNRQLVAQDRTETVVVDLVSPMGLTVQPETKFVFIASRYGIYRYDPRFDKPQEHRATVEIDGFGKPDLIGKDPTYEIGPLGLAFLDRDHLVVGGGNRKDGEELVRVYQIPVKPPSDNNWIREEAAAYTLGPIKAGNDSAHGEGNFYGVAVGAGAIWVTCGGDDAKGWIAKAEIKDGKPGELKPAIATKTATQVGAPGPITFTPDGKQLVVGQMGDTNSDAADSLLCFYDPATGKLTKKLPTGLIDLSGLAYSPKTGKLYGTDAAWKKPDAGGLFELAISGDAVKATKIVPLDKPTGVAFDSDGRMYAAVVGTSKGTGKQKTDPGTMVYFKPGF